ncbi:ubiquitination network signaling protein [Diplocarpon rosae]|nr:ubiquitination network signaling protein [Diplocarpon rosae]
MPRGPAISKRQPGAANQRDTRHENGLVGPTKRVQKQKSNGHLNGYAKAHERTSSTPPLPETPPPSSGNAQRPGPVERMAERKMVAEISRKASVDGSSDSASDVYPNAPATPEIHRQINVNSSKNPAVHHDALTFAFTVLRSCPLWDTLAILIVLLQIPPTFLSIVHLLFATLTFVPPSTATSAGLSFTDILQGTLGTPSIGTIFLIDVLVLLVWLFLWSPLQDIALDLAQTVIALTLGGGTSGKGAGMKNVLWCFSIIGVSHYFRGNMVQNSGLRAIVGSNGFLGSPDPDDPLEPRASNGNKRHGLIRSILAIHILTQGVVRYIRDWYVRREKRDISASIGDPEAGKVLDANSDSVSRITPTQENDSPASAAGGSPVATFKKKKKKQSAQVRLRQPLWAALASTKIVMVKEYETSHTAAESAGTNATGANDLGSAPFNYEADRIWITSVTSDEVAFSTSFFPVHKVPDGKEQSKGNDSGGKDKSKPFYVHVNHAPWPTRIESRTDAEGVPGQSTRWSGVIVGLAPTSSYQCDFYRTLDDSMLFSASVRTLPSASADLSVGLATGPQLQGRPGSPLPTLKASIATQQQKLLDEKKIQSSKRKDQSRKVNLLRKEIDKLNSSLQTAGGSDDKLRQKIQQNTLNMRQAEDKVLDLEAEIGRIQVLPTDDTSDYSSAKAEIQLQREEHKLARCDFDSTKLAADREIEDCQNDLNSLQHKCDTKQSRLTFLNKKHESLTDANARGLDEAQRKEREREDKRLHREKCEEFYMAREMEINNHISDGRIALGMLISAIQKVQQSQLQQGAFQSNHSPGISSHSLDTTGFTPEAVPENGGMNAGAYPWNPTPPPAFASFAPGLYSQSIAPPAYSPQPLSRTRDRSSSMLSTASHFTQSSSEGPRTSSGFAGNGKLTWEDAREERKGSSASGSGSGSGAGSVGDPKSPIASRW